jgi:positive regulator of sigma E activity
MDERLLYTCMVPGDTGAAMGYIVEQEVSVKQRGIVRRIEGSHAVVALGGGEGCGACSARESCMSLTGKRPLERLVRVPNHLNASVGDGVELELPPSATMLLVFSAFGLPVLLLLAGYWLHRAAGAAAGLVAGIAIAVLICRAASSRDEMKQRMTVIIARQCEEGEVQSEA